MLFIIADNNSQTAMARCVNQPPVQELGEVAEKYPIGTAEILSCPCKKVWKPSKGTNKEFKCKAGSPIHS